MGKNEFPPGWDEKRVKSVIAHYASQTDDEAIAEDEANMGADNDTLMTVPRAIVPQIREMIAQYERAH